MSLKRVVYMTLLLCMLLLNIEHMIILFLLQTSTTQARQVILVRYSEE